MGRVDWDWCLSREGQVGWRVAGRLGLNTTTDKGPIKLGREVGEYDSCLLKPGNL